MIAVCVAAFLTFGFGLSWLVCPADDSDRENEVIVDVSL